MNAITNKSCLSLENCTMYVTSFPCIECAKLIAQCGIRKVIYIEDTCCQILNEEQLKAAQTLFKLSNVDYFKLQV
jgi:dCMP deaminase